jgi:putative DNA base modification enzyme with NMAD domain
MKLILSRKGFDSTKANGGCPSPILGDRLCSLPIPDRGAPTTYAEIASSHGTSIAQIVEDLTRGRNRRSDGAHLDPDLRRDSIARIAGWRPMFGQAAAAQSHLANQEIGRGDLFLFFGCFRRAEQVDAKFGFVRDEPKIHVIFGWLQVGNVAKATNALAGKMPWAARHPHLAAPERYKNNTLYFASDRLSSIGLNATRGAGTFNRFEPGLILTEAGSNCSVWQLPRWFSPAGRPPLSYHGKRTRWTECGTSMRLQSVGRGQEFVLDVDRYPEARAWLRSIFRAAD